MPVSVCSGIFALSLGLILAAAETLGNVRDIALIAVLVLLFLFLFVFAVLALVMFRQMRRLATRVESALVRVESGLEKFENATEMVSGLAGTFTKFIAGGAGLVGLGKIFSRIFGGGDKNAEDEDDQQEGR